MLMKPLAAVAAVVLSVAPLALAQQGVPAPSVQPYRRISGLPEDPTSRLSATVAWTGTPFRLSRSDSLFRRALRYAPYE